MEGLFKIKRYSDCLFYAHIVLEKILKAIVVKRTKRNARLTHNLVVLAQDAGLKVTVEERDFFNDINRFNIRARYPDEKMKFYKVFTKTYTENYLRKVRKVYKELCQKLKQEN